MNLNDKTYPSPLLEFESSHTSSPLSNPSPHMPVQISIVEDVPPEQDHPDSTDKQLAEQL